MELFREMITFEERTRSDDDLCDIYYFIIEKDLLEDVTQRNYDLAVQGCLCIELDMDCALVNASISPTSYDEIEDSFADYDWTDIDITADELKMLIEIINENIR